MKYIPKNFHKRNSVHIFAQSLVIVLFRFIDETDLQKNMYLALQKFTDTTAAQTIVAIFLGKLEQMVL